jgi:hypothetical protein
MNIPAALAIPMADPPIPPSKHLPTRGRRRRRRWARRWRRGSGRRETRSAEDIAPEVDDVTVPRSLVRIPLIDVIEPFPMAPEEVRRRHPAAVQGVAEPGGIVAAPNLVQAFNSLLHDLQIGGDELQLRLRLVDFLEGNGFLTGAVARGADFLKREQDCIRFR